MSGFDGTVPEPDHLDELTIMSAPGNYPIETTMVHYRTRSPVWSSKGRRDPVGYYFTDFRMCLKCLGACYSHIVTSDGRVDVLGAVRAGMIQIVTFYPMTELNPCKRCRILSDPSPTLTGVVGRRTHRF